MHSDQYPWVELYERLMDVEGPAYAGVLVPWLESNPGERRWLAALADRPAGDFRLPLSVPVEESWRLYAASRVNGLLLLGFQQGDADGSSWPGPHLSVPQYRAFARALGLRDVTWPHFSPFFHEIVDVEQAEDEDEPISVAAVHWPALMVGPVMFSRAGVRVRAGSRRLHRDAAEHSTLYWAHRRKNRPHHDLSHGWGRNSQWRTDFRWDLLLDDVMTYNAAVSGRPDGVDLAVATDAAGPPPGGAPSQPHLALDHRRELLTNRCFITVPEPAPVADHYPYDDYLQSPA